MSLDIIEKLTAAACHGDEAAAAVEILTVCPQVFREVCDALREQCDLDFRRTGIGVVCLEVSDY